METWRTTYSYFYLWIHEIRGISQQIVTLIQGLHWLKIELIFISIMFNLLQGCFVDNISIGKPKDIVFMVSDLPNFSFIKDKCQDLRPSNSGPTVVTVQELLPREGPKIYLPTEERRVYHPLSLSTLRSKEHRQGYSRD